MLAEWHLASRSRRAPIWWCMRRRCETRLWSQYAAGQTLIDLPYPETATAIAPPGQLGARVIDGLDVLVAQGAASFELWTGGSPPPWR